MPYLAQADCVIALCINNLSQCNVIMYPFKRQHIDLDFDYLKLYLAIATTHLGILPQKNDKITQPGTWQAQLITAVIQLLFKLGGRIPYLAQHF